ncbi:MAG: poly(3-hydroxybutyrate) depolymerase, partial [Pseudomonadota bacterium]
MKLTHSGWAALLTALAACGGEAPPATNALPALAASPDITVSGISSGGYMAGQFQVARSASVAGAAIVAAGPWGCALGEIGRALGPCMSGEGLDVEPLRVKASDLAAAGRIDPLEGLADHSVLVFRGTNDAAIAPPVTQA